MQTIQLKIEDDTYNEIVQSGINIKKELYSIVEKLRQQTHKPIKSKSAFGLLKGRISDPLAWERNIRSDNDRDIYEELGK